jgi:hypothetical protein
MKIKTTLKTEFESEISIPLFLKDQFEFFAVLDESTQVSILNCTGLVSVKNEKPGAERISSNIDIMEPCTESEFMEALDKAIQTLSLKPILHDTLS